jgi:hypothetical protein
VNKTLQIETKGGQGKARQGKEQHEGQQQQIRKFNTYVSVLQGDSGECGRGDGRGCKQKEQVADRDKHTHTQDEKIQRDRGREKKGVKNHTKKRNWGD